MSREEYALLKEEGRAAGLFRPPPGQMVDRFQQVRKLWYPYMAHYLSVAGLSVTTYFRKLIKEVPYGLAGPAEGWYRPLKRNRGLLTKLPGAPLQRHWLCGTHST